MLYIFDPDEKLIALLKPDFTRSTSPATTTSRAFLMAAFPAEIDREPASGCPYWDAKHYEKLNGDNTFRFTVPADQSDAAYVQTGNLVGFKDPDADWQFFEIKRLVDLHGDGLTRTAFCEHIFYELVDDIVTDKRPSSTARSAMVAMLEGTRWNVGIVDDLGIASATAYYESALSGVQKVAIAWKGELKWRCVVVSCIITRYVDLLAMRGTDTGKQFVYGKDMLEFEREEDIAPVNTALYGRGKGVETESGTGYGRRLTFADVVWSVAGGDPVDKPAGQEWVGDPTALARWGRPGGRHRYEVFTDDEETDAAKLLHKTWTALQGQLAPRVTYRGKVTALETLAGYSHEAARLGDVNRVIDREFKPELLVSARLVELERDLLSTEQTNIVLGSFAPSIVTANINTQQRVSDLENKPYNTNWLDGRISVLRNEIENTGAYVFQNGTDGILILDAPTFAQATKAMKLGGGIFALANSKTGDAWAWRTFGDGRGFTGDEIVAGMIRAGFIQVGEACNFEAGYDPAEKETKTDAIQKLTEAKAYADTLAEALQAQIDGKIETWFYSGVPTLSNAPASEWTTTTLKDEHLGDIYYDTASGYAYRFIKDGTTYTWQEIADTVAAEALQKAKDALTAADSKIETWYQDNAPNTWPEADRTKHTGDLWFSPTTKVIKRYDGTNNSWTSLEDQLAADAYAIASGASSSASLKKRVFTSQLVPPYEVGDLWTGGPDGEIYRCITAKIPVAGSFFNAQFPIGEVVAFDLSDWEKASKYTDDSAVAAHNESDTPHNLPDYARMESDGFKVYDGSGNLRTHNGQHTDGKYGFKALHTDGSYTTMDADGLLRHIANTQKNYLFMVAGGEASTDGSCSLILKRWVTWDGPVEFPVHDDEYYYGTHVDGYQPYCNYASYASGGLSKYGLGNGVNDNGMDSITEDDVINVIADVWVTLPAEWENINYQVLLSVKNYELPESFTLNMDDESTVTISPVGNPKFVLKVIEKQTGSTPKFKVRAYYQLKNKWKTEHRFPNYWQPGSHFVETDQIFYAQGITFSYSVIA